MNVFPQRNKTFEKWRYIVLFILVGTIFGFYVLRLFDIQILQGSDFLVQADENRTQVIREPAIRGTIYDRNGVVLAQNVPSYNVVVVPGYLPEDEGDIQAIFRELSELIDIPVSRGDTDEETVRNFTPCYNDLGISEIVFIADTNWPYQATAIKCNVSKDIAMVIMENREDWTGIDVDISSVRQYPTGELTSEIIGFLGPIPAVLEEYYVNLGFVANRDKVGYAGVEQSLNDTLAGINGTQTVEVNVAGEIIRNLSEPIEPIPGNDVYLSIDTRLQAIAREALISEIEYWNNYVGKTISNNGVVIAMNPKTGEVLALVSYPNYENNRLERLIPGYYYEQLSNDPQRPLFNHAVSAEHPPGSVFKMTSALGVLNEGVVTPEYEVECPGSITVIQRFYENDPGTPREFVCWDRNGHGMVSYKWGVAYSCNIYWHKVAGGYQDEVPDGGLGIWLMSEYAKALGYGTTTGIELPGESDGLVPDPTWKRINLGENWATGDTYTAAIGQGYVLATPLQVLNSISTIANGGKLMDVTLIDQVVSGDGTVLQELTPSYRWDITEEPLIEQYDGNVPTGEVKTVEPWVIELANQAMRLVVTDGTGSDYNGERHAELFRNDSSNSAGKTGTAEYCDNVAQEQGLCQFGAWPSHAWYVGYAPWDNAEIAVVAFVYNGTEGATLSAPVVRRVIDAYFELKAIDSAETP
ncbi:MAG: penicillin-binding protein 2 [Chloroflexota bacterium]|nr:penicillin-binding protein 2 [Chloroflexota bacterium]